MFLSCKRFEEIPWNWVEPAEFSSYIKKKKNSTVYKFHFWKTKMNSKFWDLNKLSICTPCLAKNPECQSIHAWLMLWNRAVPVTTYVSILEMAILKSFLTEKPNCSLNNNMWNVYQSMHALLSPIVTNMCWNGM